MSLPLKINNNDLINNDLINNNLKKEINLEDLLNKPCSTIPLEKRLMQDFPVNENNSVQYIILSKKIQTKKRKSKGKSKSKGKGSKTKKHKKVNKTQNKPPQNKTQNAKENILLYKKGKRKMSKINTNHTKENSRQQQFEKEKLHLTAALHLEKIRIHAHCESENFNDGLNSEQQMTTYSLLNASKEQLMKSIATVVQHINEIMEELHGLVADL
jgi:hypothetical protein